MSKPHKGLNQRQVANLISKLSPADNALRSMIAWALSGEYDHIGINRGAKLICPLRPDQRYDPAIWNRDSFVGEIKQFNRSSTVGLVLRLAADNFRCVDSYEELRAVATESGEVPD